MLVEAFVLVYLGLACLARANHRFSALALPGGGLAPPRLSRTLGWALLAIALVVAAARLGIAQALVAVPLLVAGAGIPLVLLLSIRPRGALAPTVPLFPQCWRRRPSYRA